MEACFACGEIGLSLSSDTAMCGAKGRERRFSGTSHCITALRSKLSESAAPTTHSRRITRPNLCNSPRSLQLAPRSTQRTKELREATPSNARSSSRHDPETREMSVLDQKGREPSHNRVPIRRRMPFLVPATALQNCEALRTGIVPGLRGSSDPYRSWRLFSRSRNGYTLPGRVLCVRFRCEILGFGVPRLWRPCRTVRACCWQDNMGRRFS